MGCVCTYLFLNAFEHWCFILRYLTNLFQERLKKEQEEKEHKKKEKAEAHLYTIIKVKQFNLFFILKQLI